MPKGPWTLVIAFVQRENWNACVQSNNDTYTSFIRMNEWILGNKPPSIIISKIFAVNRLRSKYHLQWLTLNEFLFKIHLNNIRQILNATWIVQWMKFIRFVLTNGNERIATFMFTSNAFQFWMDKLKLHFVKHSIHLHVFYV